MTGRSTLAVAIRSATAGFARSLQAAAAGTGEVPATFSHVSGTATASRRVAGTGGDISTMVFDRSQDRRHSIGAFPAKIRRG